MPWLRQPPVRLRGGLRPNAARPQVSASADRISTSAFLCMRTSFGSLPCGALLGQGQMVIIDTVAHLAAVLQAKLVPGRGGYIAAAVFIPFDLGPVAQYAGPFLSDIRDRKEGADVEAHTVVEIGVPADGLLLDGLPAHEDVVGGLANKDQLQALFQPFSCSEFFLRTVHAVVGVTLLTADPVSQVGVDQRFQRFVIELVIVDQGSKAIAQAVPDVPDKWTMTKQRTVLDEEFVAQPAFQRLAGMISGRQQLRQDIITPVFAI